jgi:glycine cleavage system H protein
MAKETPMSALADRRYLETHEWHKVAGDIVEIGITKIAADELTDITFVDLPKVGARVTAGEAFGEIESLKATADLLSGISGSVVEVNTALNDNPGLVNQDAYAGGWMIRVKADNPADVETLLSAEDYLKATGH